MTEPRTPSDYWRQVFPLFRLHDAKDYGRDIWFTASDASTNKRSKGLKCFEVDMRRPYNGVIGLQVANGDEKGWVYQRKPWDYIGFLWSDAFECFSWPVLQSWWLYVSRKPRWKREYSVKRNGDVITVLIPTLQMRAACAVQQTVIDYEEKSKWQKLNERNWKKELEEFQKMADWMNEE